MAVESSPYPEEEQLENDLTEALLALLALALVTATSLIKPSTFQSSDFPQIQEAFRSKASEGLSDMSSTAYKAIKIGVDRTSSDLKLSSLSIDYSDSRFNETVTRIFTEQIDRLIATNYEFFEALVQEAAQQGWSSEELARRLKTYFGLTPRYLKTALNTESALKAEKIAQKILRQKVQQRVDQLIEVRLRLSATLIATAVVEGAKDAAFTQLLETGQLDQSTHVKEWVSVVDDVTTQVCLSSHKTIAELGGVFPNGFSHPPATNPVHPCRSSVRVIKRPN